ncbi:PRC-barrel domain-containing protein [Chthonobacter rhizosphaerae]|uniref:PRC-barrel domain-containing protein n=1 Tax=Chthonobacter rhizosphaerae TaxID=2735553 RepID=UPI0015EFAE3B|nr:PRC-barrel domain-containing protein [Chthonobacter rhizosphaerae]
MTGRLFAILLASAALPAAAFAQDTSTPPAQQDPAMMQPAPSGGGGMGAGAQPGDPAQGLPAAAGEDARGGMPDTDVTQDTTVTGGESGQMTAGMQSEGPFVTVPAEGAWRAADLEGKAVFGADGESIGDIKDILVNDQGQVAAVIIGVGGFLGIGEKDVAVAMNALQFGPGMTAAEAEAAGATGPAATGEMAGNETAVTGTTPTMAPTGSTTTGDPGATGSTGSTTGTGYGTESAANDVRIGADGLPDRIVLNVTKQQLEDAPAFEGMQAATPQ